MSTTPVLGRRAMLAGTCLTCVGLVAGCGSDDDTATTGAPAPVESAAPSAAAPAGSAAAPTAAGLVALDKVPVGGGVVVVSGSETIVVTQPEAGTVRAFSAKCTHQGVIVGVKGKQIVCPAHGSKFALADGAVVQGPAASPLAKVAVAVKDGQVVSA